ncbi:ATP-grasp fold amidoligase family protein [Mariniflexile ostreae]|uniref:ATP-grasp fold amidoligase family protein n=1 Tax=Mariniflexile ostreae TaxID=1520892 RepID=A0ABV5F813_9FLAO
MKIEIQKMIEKIKCFSNKHKKNTLVKVLKSIYDLFKFYLISDRAFVKLSFRMSHGYTLDLNNPKSLNEKIQWLKLHDRTSLHTQCADKYRVRDYVRDKIGEDYLIPLFFFTKKPTDINLKKLENLLPCIVKTNHNSSGGIIFKDVKNQNWKEHQKWLTNELKKDYYLKSREWQYKNIERGIVVEKLLQNSKGEIPFDYKVHCFNGKTRMIQVDLFRDSDNYSRNWYTSDWNLAPFGWYSEKEGEIKKSKGVNINPPKCLEHMLELSEELSTGFVYSRIDWYDVDGKLFFGEITFHHDGGLRPIEPKKWDFILGNELDLTPILNRI